VNGIRAQKKLGEAQASRFETLSFAENRGESNPTKPARET
jgi:hypothetical protein